MATFAGYIVVHAFAIAHFVMIHTRRLMEQAAGTALPGWDILRPFTKKLHLHKGELVFAAGEWQPYVYVVTSGIVKLTYLGIDGVEWIKSFIGPGDFFACPNVLISGQATDYFAAAIDECVLEQVDYAPVRQLCDQYPPWQKAIRQLLEQHIVRKEQRERELLTMTPEDRYLSFLTTYPELAEQLQLRDIARYLGVTPEALSRIRKRLRL